MIEGIVLSVSQLNEYVSALLATDPLLNSLEIEGEISGFKRYSSGHCYFSLKDATSLIRCVMFRQNAYKLDITPKDGMRVIVRGYVSLYARDGQYQLYAQSMRAVGEGELYRRFMELKAKLEAQGLFSPEHKKPLPYLPKRVGVITSKSGAAFLDIQSVIARRFPNMPITLIHSSVQGAQAPNEIIDAISRMDAASKADVIIVGRGGGSIEELWAYNDEGVARAIYDCKIPVISAVGHETDFTIADFVADVRAATPSVAAEIAVPIYAELVDALNQRKHRLSYCVSKRLEAEALDIHALKNKSAFANIRFRLDNEELHVEKRRVAMSHVVSNGLYQRRSEIAANKARLDSLSPELSLRRGFVLMRSVEGHPIYTRSTLLKVESAVVSFTDGDATVRLKEEA